MQALPFTNHSESPNQVVGIKEADYLPISQYNCKSANVCVATSSKDQVVGIKEAGYLPISQYHYKSANVCVATSPKVMCDVK